MKKAVILVGKRKAGKSLTIRKHLKPRLKIGLNQHKFCLNGKQGYIFSQSVEEAKRDVISTVIKVSNYELVVLASWPDGYDKSQLREIRESLKKAGFSVYIVTISKPEEAPSKASEIFDYLKR